MTTTYQYGYGPNGQYGQTQTTTYDTLGMKVTTFTPSYQSYQPSYKSTDNSLQSLQLEYINKKYSWEREANQSELVKAVRNKEDWHAAADITQSKASPGTTDENILEVVNTTFLVAIREALKIKEFDVAWDIACYYGRNLDKNGGGKGFAATALAVEKSYSDVYFFLIEKVENPRAAGVGGYTLMDWFDQGIRLYDINSSYREIEQDLVNRGVQLRARKPIGCCLIC